jgi:acyl-CoA-binding protein
MASGEKPPRSAPRASAGLPTGASSRNDVHSSIADLKNAFLSAVAFCRPLLSSDASAAPAAGSRVEGGMVSPASALTLSDQDKLTFYAYFKQATAGDCQSPTNDDDISMMVSGPGHEGDVGHHHVANQADMSASSLAVTKAKRDAWLKYKGMRRRDAMRAFVSLLDSAVPGWDKVPGGSPVT